MSPNWREVNWQAVEDRLFAFAVEGIRRFAADYPDAACSFLAYDVDLPFFLLSFDTPGNALRVAQSAIARRAKMLIHPNAWRGAQHFSTSPPVLDHSRSVGYFAYHDFASLNVPEVEDLWFAEDYPQDEAADDFTTGNTRIVLWKVIERLIADGSLRSLRLASPCRLGYEMHDDGELTVLRILNWPTSC
jgi:hypothetical protein